MTQISEKKNPSSVPVRRVEGETPAYVIEAKRSCPSVETLERLKMVLDPQVDRTLDPQFLENLSSLLKGIEGVSYDEFRFLSACVNRGRSSQIVSDRLVSDMGEFIQDRDPSASLLRVGTALPELLSFYKERVAEKGALKAPTQLADKNPHVWKAVHSDFYEGLLMSLRVAYPLGVNVWSAEEESAFIDPRQDIALSVGEDTPSRSLVGAHITPARNGACKVELFSKNNLEASSPSVFLEEGASIVIGRRLTVRSLFGHQLSLPCEMSAGISHLPTPKENLEEGDRCDSVQWSRGGIVLSLLSGQDGSGPKLIVSHKAGLLPIHIGSRDKQRTYVSQPHGEGPRSVMGFNRKSRMAT